MTPPDFIDHRNGNTLLAALESLLPAPSARPYEASEALPTLDEVCIASAFFSPAGFGSIANRLHGTNKVRLLLGAEAPPEVKLPIRRPGDSPPKTFHLQLVRKELDDLNQGLRRERDRLPFTAHTAAYFRHVAHMLRSNKLEVRRYEHTFLHAKAYIFDGLAQSFIAGSSNLTRAGLTANMELNLGLSDIETFTKAREWYNSLWEEAEPFDLAAFFEEIECPFTPYEIFLRVLFQLYGKELDQERQEVGEIPLTAFQQHGVWRANRILRDLGGVIIADEVGLGKTFIAGQILEAYSNSRRRALLVCPAALRDTTWKDFLARFGISRRVECVSYEQLGRDVQFADPRRPHANQTTLTQLIDDYSLIVVDEAHNYRNPDAPYRAAVLRRLLFGPRKDLLLLTATPVNNSLWDLFHLIRFFVRQDSVLGQQGIVSIRERFEHAARIDPSNLNPDYLYPIIDAVTVKRTRGFVKKYYSGETIRGPDGRLQPIIFPRPEAITVRYELERLLPGLFADVADALDPDHGRNLIRFARYSPDTYRLNPDPDDQASAELSSGLLRSGLLKRFESSAYAFGESLRRMIEQHDQFLAALDKGKVITTAFYEELAELDDTAFDELLESSENVSDAAGFDVPRLRRDITRDRDILAALATRVSRIDPSNDPKLQALFEELASIAAEATANATDGEQAQRDRKVLVFSFFADTIRWMREAFERRIAADQRLAPYRKRVAAVAGSQDVDKEDISREAAVWGFAPESSRPPPGRDQDLYDLLLSTDVLAEGMNLQQCRHIINYDMPWNPMRLVQRHGRIDRIGSPHPRVYLRTIFPADKLDQLLNLEARILRKLAQAARSIGVGTPPIRGAERGEQVFAETRAEIERLAREDSSIYERGGTEAAAQTGEEYRQRLRAALQQNRAEIEGLPGKAGSGMRKGTQSGVFFCAEVEMADDTVRTFLRFVPATPLWLPSPDPNAIVSEIGSCLRLIECLPETERYIPPALSENVFAFWDAALADITEEWDRLSDPANLQPRIRPLNRRVADFIRSHPPADIAPATLNRSLDILEAPWPRREEQMLRERFESLSSRATGRSRALVDWILETGLEPFISPLPLPDISREDIRLICWLAIEANDATH